MLGAAVTGSFVLINTKVINVNGLTRYIGICRTEIESVGKYIKVPKIISGATILGNGEVALILDANALF